MRLLQAVTKKRRNLLRIERAYRTDYQEAVYRRDKERALLATHRRKQLTADVLRIYAAECKAAK